MYDLPWVRGMAFWATIASHGLAVPPVTLTRSRPDSTVIEVFAEFHQGAVPAANVPLTTSWGAAVAGAADNAMTAEAATAIERVNSRT
ncbi:hypothetical protein GCM10023096_81800 [Nonomuraea ferruginea]